MTIRNKDIRAIVKDYLAQGFTLERGKRHTKLVHESGRKFAIPGAVTGPNTLGNFRNQVKHFAQECGA